MKGKIYAIALFSLLSQAYMGQAKCDLVRISGGPSTQLVRLPSKNYYCAAGQKIKLEAAYEKINETNKYTVASLPFSSAPLPFDKDLKNVFAKTGTTDDHWSETIAFKGTRDVNGDGVIDQTAAEQKDPYNICFFGQQYSSVTIQDNGVISFTPGVMYDPVDDPGQTLAKSDGAYLLSTDHGLPNHSSLATKFGHIFGAFHDLNYNDADNVNQTNPATASWEIIGTFPCRKLVVLFKNVPHFKNKATTDVYTNQMIVLNENSNYIDVFIKDKPMNYWEDGVALIGIQNISGDGPDDYAVPEEFRNQPKNADGESMEGIFKKALTNVAYRFSPAGKESVPKFEWLTKTTGAWQSQVKTKTVELTLNEKTYIKSSIKQAACGVDFESTDEVSVEPLDIQLPAQTAGTCANPTVTLKVKEYSSKQIKYQWYKDNVAIAGATSYLYNASTAGNYKVEVSYDNSIWNCNVAAATVVSLGSAPKLNDYSHSACSQGTAATTLDLNSFKDKIIANPANYIFGFYSTEALALAGGTADITPTTYAAAVGSATVWVRVSQGINCSSVAKLNININAAMNAGNTTKVAFCKNEDSLDLTTKLGSGIATTGKWTPALPSGTNIFNPKTDAPGRYTYTLTGTAPCPNSSAILEVSVSPIANAGKDADALTLCKSDRAVDIFILLKNSPASNGTWQPTLASGGNMFNPAKDAPGLYTYTVKGVAPCPSASASINIAITDLQSMLGNTIIDTGNTICDDNFTGNHIVDDLKNMDHSKLIANPSQYTFTYYANERLSPRITNTQNYNLGSTMPATIYVKILSATGCSAVAKMIYSLRSATPLLVSNQILTNCDNDAKPSDGLSSFNLQSTQAGFNTDNSTTFDYYTTLNGAKTSLASDKIANITAYNNTRNNQVVYVRIQQKDFCPSIASINLKVNTPPNAGANPQLALCKNSGLVDLLSKLGSGIKSTGQWSPALVSNSSYFDPTKDQPGKYTYTLPGTAPCGNATAEIEVLVHEVPVAGKNAKITLCQSDAPVDLFLKLGPTAALGGTWSPALSQGILNPKTDKSGTYTYTVTGTAPCVDATAKVEVTVIPLANAGQDTPIAICKTDAPFALLSRLDGNPSAGGTWTPALANNGVFNPALDAPGEYTYTLAGTAPCASMSSKLTINMMDIKLKDANSFVQLENNLCDEFFNGVHKVNLSQMDHSKLVENHTQYQYSYYQDAAAQKPINSNLYDLGPILPATVYVKITNSNGCSVMAPMQYSNPKLTPLIKPEHMMSECDNDQKPNNDYFTFKPQDSKKEFNADPSTSFEYYTSLDAAKLKQTAFKLSDAQLLAFQNTIAKAQTLYVRVQQPGFCPVMATLKLEVKRIPMAEFLPADKFCPSSQKNIKLEAKSGLVEYLWQNAAGQNLGTTASILVNKNGIYSLTTKGFNGCTNTEKIEITDYKVPEIEQIEYRNGSINVIAKGGEPSYEYSFDNGKTWTINSEFSGEPNIYKVLVRNAKGQCESARMDVPVLGFSNIITPNGDGVNDQFSIIGLETFTNINLAIYDRYGTMVYQNQADSDKKISWDGRYQGRTLATSTYWYTLAFTDPLTGQVYNFNSYITIKNRD